MAESTTVTLSDIDGFKANALKWANQFRVVCLLDSNNYPHINYSSKEWLLAVDSNDEISCNENSFGELRKFQLKTNATFFGFLSYDLKNEIEALDSRNYDGLKFPELYFFKPRYVFEIKGDKLTLNRNYPETFELLEAINKQSTTTNCKLEVKRKLLARTSKQTYLQNIEKIRRQIEDGDFYEINYCNEFYVEKTELNPLETFLKLNDDSKAPFSCYFKLEDKFLICASPERFLKKEERKLISQPIKGTIKKGDS